MRNLWLAFALPITLFAGPAGADEEPPQGSLGQKAPGLLNLRGEIHYLAEATQEMPDLSITPVEGVIYTSRLDVPQRSFTAGFPGVTNRFEWFGVMYQGSFEVAKAGEHGFRLSSDDGSRLWIDDTEVINNDGVHGENSVTGTIQLKKGPHTIKVWYFQGPATEIALQLFVTPPKGAEKIFDLADFSGDLKKALGSVKAEATAEGIKISLDTAVLFDPAKSVLKPKAKKIITSLAKVLAAYANAKVRIDGHTDSDGSDSDNQALSEARARSVADALRAAGPKSRAFETKGYGETLPIADNASKKGKARNRRVEVFVIP